MAAGAQGIANGVERDPQSNTTEIREQGQKILAEKQNELVKNLAVAEQLQNDIEVDPPTCRPPARSGDTLLAALAGIPLTVANKPQLNVKLNSFKLLAD